jgi:hypothetical protein
MVACSNPDLALARLAELPDDNNRTGAALQVARDIAYNRPDQAARLIGQYEAATADELTQLDLISAKASLAASQQRANELHSLLQSGFQLATRLLSESKSIAARAFLPGLAPLVQTGAGYETDMTVEFVEGLPPSRIKAELLIAAANALETMRLRERVTSYPVQNPPNRRTP